MTRLLWAIGWGAVAIALLVGAVWLASIPSPLASVTVLIVAIAAVRQSYRSFKAPVE